MSTDNTERSPGEPKPKRKRRAPTRARVNAEALAQAREALEGKCKAQAAKRIYNVLPCKIGPMNLLKLWFAGRSALKGANSYDVWLASKLVEDFGSVEDAIFFLEEQESASKAVLGAMKIDQGND